MPKWTMRCLSLAEAIKGRTAEVPVTKDAAFEELERSFVHGMKEVIAAIAV
jgi:hypothetical protein